MQSSLSGTVHLPGCNRTNEAISQLSEYQLRQFPIGNDPDPDEVLKSCRDLIKFHGKIDTCELYSYLWHAIGNDISKGRYYHKLTVFLIDTLVTRIPDKKSGIKNGMYHCGKGMRPMFYYEEKGVRAFLMSGEGC